MAKLADQEKKPKDPKEDFLEAHKDVNYILVAPTRMSPRGSKKSPPSNLDGPRSPFPSITVTTRTLYQS
jgi:hypothetical protein